MLSLARRARRRPGVTAPRQAEPSKRPRLTRNRRRARRRRNWTALRIPTVSGQPRAKRSLRELQNRSFPAFLRNLGRRVLALLVKVDAPSINSVPLRVKLSVLAPKAELGFAGKVKVQASRERNPMYMVFVRMCLILRRQAILNIWIAHCLLKASWLRARAPKAPSSARVCMVKLSRIQLCQANTAT